MIHNIHKRMKKRSEIIGICICILSKICIPIIPAQTDPVLFLEELASNLPETTGEYPDPEEVTVWLKPPDLINLNQATSDQLLALPGITGKQATALWKYLTTYGEVYSLSELQVVEGFDSVTILRISPYLYIGPVRDRAEFSFRNLAKQGRHELLFRYQQQLQQRAGYRASGSGDEQDPGPAYPGSPQGYLFRYRYSYRGKIVVGLSGEKDAGEQFFRGEQRYGFDFYSGYLAINHIGWLENLTIGHFRCSFGQGLTLGAGSYGSSPGFTTTPAFTSDVRPTQSTSESGYFRGLSFSVQAGRACLSGFVSYTFRDAKTEEDSTSDIQPVFSSFLTTGYHRTNSEQASKGTVPELVYGGGIRFRGNFFLIGVTGYAGKWFGNYQPEEEVYRRFILRDESFGAAGVDGRIRLGKSQLYGEWSVTGNGATAWLIGITATPVSGFDFLAVARNYQQDYGNPFSSALSQNGDRNNEQGAYFRFSFPLFNRFRISAFTDLFRFPWVKYRTDGSSEGMESGAAIAWQINPFWDMNFRYLFKEWQQNAPSGYLPVRPLLSCYAHELRYQTHLEPVAGLRLGGAAVLKITDQGTQSSPGYLFCQDLRYRSGRHAWTVTARYTLFDCPDYPTRIYLYEPDVWYSYSVPSFYGKGIGFILLISKSLGKWLDVWLRLNWTHYTDRDHLGSGADEIRGNDNSMIRVQFRISV